MRVRRRCVCKCQKVQYNEAAKMFITLRLQQIWQQQGTTMSPLPLEAANLRSRHGMCGIECFCIWVTLRTKARNYLNLHCAAGAAVAVERSAKFTRCYNSSISNAKITTTTASKCDTSAVITTMTTCWCLRKWQKKIKLTPPLSGLLLAAAICGTSVASIDLSSHRYPAQSHRDRPTGSLSLLKWQFMRGNLL